MAFTYVTVAETYETAGDVPARGTVEFTPVDQMHNGLTVVSAAVTATLDPAGAISIRIAATTDPATYPVGVTYRVVERLTGQATRTYYVSVPHNQGATLQLANLTTVQGSSGATGFALRNATDYDDSVAPADGQVMTWDSTTTKYHPEATSAGASAVTSVNGATGAVTITASGLGAQPVDTDLTAIAALAPADGSLLSRQAGAWAGRTSSQVKTDLAIDQVNNTSDAAKPVSTATSTALAGKAASVHTHPAADVVSGTIATARLASGTANATTFLRGDQTWAATAGSATAIDSTIVDAKGDLIAATAADTVARLGVGGNGQVLTASSAASTGLAWATPSASAAAADGRFNIKDYGAVGNGTTDDTTSIQNALNAASTAGGGIVFVPRSTGSFIFTTLDIPSNVTFLGLGGTLKLKDNTTIANLSYFPISISARTNVHLVDLTIDGNSANNPGDVTTVVSDSITMVSCSYSSIRGCTVNNSPDSAIMFSRCTNSKLLNNVVNGARDTGFYVNDGDGTLFSECLIQGNIILNCDYGGIALKRLTQRVIVSNNTIRDCGNGITLEHVTGTDFSSNMTVTGNRMRHIGYNVGDSGTPAGIGIDLRGGQYVVCSGNHIEDVAVFGVKIEGGKYNTVSSNFVLQTPTVGQAAFVCWERSEITTGAQHNTFVGNVAIGGPTAFWISGVSGKASDNITLVGNHAIQANSIGLRVDQFVTNLTLIGNVFGGGTTDVNINASAGTIYPLFNRLINGTQSGTFNPFATVRLAQYTTAGRPSATSVGAGTAFFNTTTNIPNYSDGTNWRNAAGTVV